MEALKELMAKRRAETERLKQMAGVAAASNGRKKFVRRRDLERARKAEFLATQRKEDEKDVLRKHKVAGAIDDKGQIADVGGSSATPKRSRPRRDDDTAAGVGAGAGAGQAASPAATPTPKRDATGSNPESPAVELPKEEVVKRLRQLELPVTCVGDRVAARGCAGRSRAWVLPWRADCLESRMVHGFAVCERLRHNTYACLWLRRISPPLSPLVASQGEGADGDDMRLGAGHDIVRRDGFASTGVPRCGGLGSRADMVLLQGNVFLDKKRKMNAVDLVRAVRRGERTCWFHRCGTCWLRRKRRLAQTLARLELPRRRGKQWTQRRRLRSSNQRRSRTTRRCTASTTSRCAPTRLHSRPCTVVS